MKVNVLVAGVYAGPTIQEAVKAEIGQVITIVDGDYAASLIADGFVMPEGAAPKEETASQEQETEIINPEEAIVEAATKTKK